MLTQLVKVRIVDEYVVARIHFIYFKMCLDVVDGRPVNQASSEDGKPLRLSSEKS